MNFDRIPTAISNGELERRWRLVRNLMSELKLDALVLQNSNDWLGGYVRWFTGVPAHNAYPRTVLFFRDEPMTVVEQGAFGSRHHPEADDFENRGIGTIVGSPSYVSAGYTATYDADLAAKELKSRSVRAIGVVGQATMYHSFAKYLFNSIPSVTCVDVTEEIDLLKAVKSTEEQDLIRETASLQDAVIGDVRDFIRPGMFDYEVTAYAQYCAQKRGSEQGIFLGSSAPVGKASLFRGRSAQGRRIEKGDNFTLLVEVNGRGGYYTEIARTFVLGKASAQMQDDLNLMIEAQRYTLSLLKPGADSKEIFDAYNEYVERKGLRPERRLHCHGQGYDMVERPLIRFDESMRILPGMSIVVHPGKMTAENFAVVCDNYLIGDNGPSECLHRTPQSIIEL